MELAALEWHLYVAQAAGRAVFPARDMPVYTFSGRPPLPDGITDSGGALAWLERHRIDLAEALRTAVHSALYELAYRLADAMRPLFILHKHHHEAVEVYRLALEATTRWGDHTARTRMRKRLARVLLHLDLLDEARRHIDELLDLARADGDLTTLSGAMKTLGGLHSRTGDHMRSAEAFEEALLIIREQDRPRAEGLTLIDLGAALVDAGDPRQATAHLTDARRILSALRPPDRYNAARASLVLATAHLRLGQLDSARTLLDNAILVFAEFAAHHERARAHDELAAVLGAAGDADGARAHSAEARRIRSFG